MSVYTDRCTLYRYAEERGRCDYCGALLGKRQRRWCSKDCAQTVGDNHYWNQARNAARKRDRYKCVQCGGWGTEVNHITPRNGAGYKSGCWHHLDGLETLCDTCHLTVTLQQRRARAGVA